MQRAADRLRAHAAKLAALVDMAEAQHRSVLEHEPELASTSLRHLARLEADCDEAQRVADAAQLQADEFAGEPSIDAALDFFNNIADVIEGKIMKAEGMAELNATLRGLLEAAWLDIDDRKRIAASFRPCVTDAILDGDACHELEFLTHPDYAEKLARIGEQTGRQTFV